MLAEHEDAAREVLPGGGAIDPADGVFDVAVLLLQVEELVDSVELDSLVVDVARDDGTEPELRPGDETRKSHPANGCGVPVGILGARAEAAGAVGADEFEARYVIAE